MSHGSAMAFVMNRYLQQNKKINEKIGISTRNNSVSVKKTDVDQARRLLFVFELVLKEVGEGIKLKG